MTLPYDLNILDVVLLSVIALFTLRGALRGFLDEVAGLVGILGGVWLAGRYYGELGRIFSQYTTSQWVYIVAYVLILCMVMFVISMISRALHSFLKMAYADWINHLAGAAVGGLKGFLICAVMVTLLTYFINDAEGKQVLAMSEEEDYDYPAIDAIGHVLSREDFNDEHIRRVLALPLVDVEAVRKRRFKVVVDAVNSVGGIVMPKLLRELGCEVVELNCEPTGEFAHNPEPLPQNLTEISEVIVREKADLGIVVDPDVDRLAFVSEDGSMFVEEYTLVAVADYILSEKPGNTVSNLSSSRALRDVTERHGGKYYASAVGEVNVVAKMKEVGAVIGGEGNGGVIYPELHYGRDALVGTALFLTWLAKKGMTMTRLRATYPSYYASKNKIELTPAIDVDKVLREVKGRYAGENVNDIDGVKIDFAENWVHLRKSNTEPIIRVYTEAKSIAEADALAQRFIGEIKAICNI